MLMPAFRGARAPAEPAADPTCTLCEVRARALFSVLTPAQLADAAEQVTHQRFGPGEALYRQGLAGGALYTIRRGIVRFERAGSDGARRIVRLAGAGALIGQESLLLQPYAEDAVACTPVEACRIPRAAIEDHGTREPQMLRELMRRWQSALDASGQWAAEVTRGSARRRVLQLLLQLQQLSPDGRSLWMPSRLEMGDMLGLATETASRVVSALRRQGVLANLQPGSATLDADRLQEVLAQEDR